MQLVYCRLAIRYLRNYPQAIGLSSLMTTTVDSTHQNTDYLRSRGVKYPIIVGGAVLTEDIALSIGATYYSKDALQTARLMKDICS
jgi:5-methyltetrahydrofolate--homocysteine methyltransferase